MKNKIITLISLVIVYFLLKNYIIYWTYIVYPISILVTFMHEFWHAFFAIITGWDVKGIQINSDWSWFTTTSWWIRDIVISWWYLGSAIFWNILLYIWFRKEKLSKNILYFIWGLMIFVSIFWFNSIYSSIILILLAGLLIFLAKKTKYYGLTLQFLWVSSLMYIIEDFSVWPSSDLSKFSWIIPSYIWMIVWLLLVILITGYNLKLIFKR